MIESGTTDLRRHVLLRGRDREGDASKPVCAACWARRSSSFPVADARTPAEGLARAERFIKEFKDDGLIVPAVAPHALYTNDKATLVAAAELARKYGVPLVIHLAETEDEVRIARERYQPHADRLSRLDWPARTNHHRRPRRLGDRRRISPSSSAPALGVSHNPESNMKLASGAAPVDEVPGRRRQARPRHRRGGEQQRPRHVRGDAAGVLPCQARHPRSRRRCRHRTRSTWPPSAARGSRHGEADRIAGNGEAGGSHHGVDEWARQTPLYNPVSHLVYVTRGDDVRDDDRQRQDPDARPPADDAQS